METAVEAVSAGFPPAGLRTPEQTVNLSEAVQDVVRQGLRYADTASIQSLETDQVTTCVGYSIVGSEALEKADVSHYVAFMNGHANLFVPVEVDHSRRVWMVDMLCSDLNQDVTDYFTLYKHDQAEARSYGTLRASSLLSDKMSYDAMYKEYPWVGIKEYPDERLEPDSNRRLIVTLNEPLQGREVVRKYAEFKEAYESHEQDAAFLALRGLAGRFPDVDIRGTSVKRVKNLSRKLAEDGRIDDAKEAISAFFGSFIGSDPRLPEYTADCARDIARVSGRPEFARRALQLYENSLPKRKTDRRCILGKIATSKQLLTQLEG